MDFFGWNTVIGLTLFIYLLYLWEGRFYRNCGIKSLPGRVPLLGHRLYIALRLEHLKDFALRAYRAYPDEKYIGIKDFLRPLVVIKDLELVKQITIKDHDYFPDHSGPVSDMTDPLFGNILISMKGQKWRDMRSTVSPAFTGVKMKMMFDFMTDCAVQLVDYLDKQAETSKAKGGGGVFELELKDSFGRFTNDVICTAIFGVQVNSLEERNNLFYTMAQKVNFNGIQFVKLFLVTRFPKLMKMLGVTFLPENVNNFYRRLVLDAMKKRSEENIVRPDMIHLLMQARNGSLVHGTSSGENKDAGFATTEESKHGKQIVKRKWQDDDIVAQALAFLVAGFDTSSTALCFAVHEIALHSDIQRRLHEEIDQVAEKNHGKIYYPDLQNMKYMDMVISEALRRWPPGVIIDRICVKPYTLPPPNDKTTKGYQVKVGDAIDIPIYAFHHDPKYFKNPEVFDPERFSDENKGNIKPYTYAPFGIGPRNCIGSRFSLMQIKAGIFHIFLHYDVFPTKKTQDPIKLKNNTFLLNPQKGFWLGFKRRKN